MNSLTVPLKRNLATLAVGAASCSILHAASIAVPNGSFESPYTLPIGVSTSIDSWQKPTQPGYYNPATYGYTWDQTSGVFYDSNPYVNHDGIQCAYLLSFPQAGLFQDYSVSPGFNATYNVGQSYTLTLGVFGKLSNPNDSLLLSLYYRDAGNNMVTIGTPTTITYNAATFPLAAPLNLVDYSVTIPNVQAGDAWAGKNIGVMIQIGDGSTFDGYWDMDNVRLTSVPEPGIASLLALGICGLVIRRATGKR
jgi:hypothetical protein